MTSFKGWLLKSPYPVFTEASVTEEAATFVLVNRDSVVRRSSRPANPGDRDSIPGSGRSPGGGHGNPLQYSCLENPHRQRSLVAGDLRELPRVPLRGEGSWGGGGAAVE